MVLQHEVSGQTRPGLIQNSYDISKQRLLVISTGHFIYTTSQGQMDADSAMLFACRMYGLNRLLPFNEGFSDGEISPASNLLHAGKTGVVRNLLNYAEGPNKIHLLLELGAYYLFKPGIIKTDLDSALIFIQEAKTLSNNSTLAKWQNESLSLLGKYYFQTGDLPQSEQYFSQVINACAAANDLPGLALAYENRGKYLPYNDPAKLSYLEKSIVLFRKLQMKEKEIELMTEIVGFNFIFNKPLAEKQLQEALALQNAIGYRHTMYTSYVLSYLADLRSDYITALNYAKQSLENMQETGASPLSCLFYMRMGAVYSHLHKENEALSWFRKSLNETKTPETQFFWYKSFLSAAKELITLDRIEEALALIREISIPFPPKSVFEKMHLAVLMGECYDKLQDYVLAEENYKTFLSIADKFPAEHIHADLPEAYYQIANFYFKKGEYSKSRIYLQKVQAPSSVQNAPFNLVNINWMLYKLDSVAGRYQSAIQYYKKYTFYADSMMNVSQRRLLEELTVKYETDKKDQSIQYLTQSGQLQQAELKQSNFLRNLTLVGLASLFIIIGLLYNQYRIKQRSNKEISSKNSTLQHLVDEKEWLLKEVHHRVKNNLQTIVSLLESQSENLHDEALSAVQDSQNRVYAMSLIHQKLYHTDNVAAIEMRSYLPELVHHLRDSFNVSRRIHIHLQISPLELDVSQAVPIGLIINEAITNSIKHAFPGKEIGQEITITLGAEDENLITLTIADNGIGLPTDFDSSHGLGLKLMKGLVGDIEGTFERSSQNGTIITIHFFANTPLHKASAVMHAI